MKLYQAAIFFFFCLINVSIAHSEESVRLLFVGDLMGHESQISSAEIKKNLIYDYRPCFKYIKPILEQADLAIGNLEVTLPGEPPYTGFPRFRSPDALAVALKAAGIHLLTTANNHCNDSGPEGLTHTLEVLDSLAILHTGTFRSFEEREANYPLIVYLKGFRLAFLNYTYGTNRIQTIPPTVVNLISEKLIAKDIKRAKKIGSDAIIVMIHWGKEYSIVENTFQSNLAKKLLSWGAQLVIGTHPHVLQPIKELFIGSERKVVAYSLGNCISGQTKPHTDRSILFEVGLKKKAGSAKAFIASHHYIPIWRYIKKKNDGRLSYMVLPVSPFEKEIPSYLEMTPEDKIEFKKSAQWIRQHLSKYDSSERKLTLEELEQRMSSKKPFKQI